MEFVIELIGEIISALFEWFIGSPKVPKPLRIFVICLLNGAVIALCIMLYAAVETKAGVIVLTLVIALMLFLGYKGIRKIMKQ